MYVVKKILSAVCLPYVSILRSLKEQHVVSLEMEITCVLNPAYCLSTNFISAVILHCMYF